VDKVRDRVIFGGHIDVKRIAIGLLIAALAAVLTGCKDDAEKRRAAFMERCVAAKFVPQQCAFLLTIVEKARSDAEDAEDDALNANAMLVIHNANMSTR
jgi:hypothetical protein